jgi:type II secretory pathway component HofQ
MPHRAAPALAVALCASTFACATARDDRAEPTTPAAMVGLPSPIIEPPPPTQTSNATTLDDAAPLAARSRHATRIIADSPAPAPAHHGRRIDLDVKGADIHDVLRLLADVGRVSIVVADDVQGSVTVRMRQVPWDQALDVILRTKGFSSEREGDVILVTAKPR